jgi:competence protein ComEC
MDVIRGRDYFFIGDSVLVADELTKNFHIKPCRALHRIQSCHPLPNFMRDGTFLQLGTKRILLIDRTVLFDSCLTRTRVDALIISNNPRISLVDISKTFTFGSVVFDGSVPLWKIRYWEKDCRRLQIPFYDVSEKGAFVMNLN